MNLLTLLAAVTLTFHGQERGPILGMLGDTTCTAVLISSNKVLTANHCISDVPLVAKVRVVDSKGKSYKLHLIYNDEDKDLAVLSIEKYHFDKWVKLGILPSKGSKVYAYNSGEGFEGTYNEGIICNLMKDPETKVHQFLTNCLILPGGSGSGLFNSKGELIGIYQWTEKGLAGGVDITEVKSFLKKAHVSI